MRQWHWWILGAKSAILTERFCSEFRLRILSLGSLLHLEGTGGIVIPYKGYVEASLVIPGLPQYNEDMLFLVILDNKHGKGYQYS